jgi:hypothetical protein
MNIAVTLGRTFEPIWSVWLQNRRGEFMLVCATSVEATRIDAVAAIKRELAK